MELRQPCANLSKHPANVEFVEVDIAERLARELVHHDDGAPLALDLDAPESVDTRRADAPGGALGEHPRLPVVRLGPPMRNAHDQGRRPLQGDVVDLILLTCDDPADVEDGRLRDLANRFRHDA